jgi:hypothetical protein
LHEAQTLRSTWFRRVLASGTERKDFTPTEAVAIGRLIEGHRERVAAAGRPFCIRPAEQKFPKL